MNTLLTAAAALALSAALAPAHASLDLNKATELAKASGCYSCHAPDEKIVGPSFKSIANKYAGEADAAATLAQSVQNGSRGKWGRVPMPPHGSLSPADLKLLGGWVLTFKD
ncbi:c-type cytochrome [Aquabacterium sp. A08]|uniref:c-type cytochrome n=1 Tax=Aquabacterium sp. A08 TaxID=2718532 RepID=UPI001422E9DE|nr:c-type cytochrome [Aquabacterium sp. A08]NIC40907.1 cytochrome C' [Aquabacterium sp. A08]NIC43638.1 cytochrome C' [Aquabacterium sp. A08]